MSPLKKRNFVIVGLIAFAFPAVVLAVSELLSVPTIVRKLLPVFVFFGPAVYWWKTKPADKSAARSAKDNVKEELGAESETDTDDLPNLELLAANYSRLSEESQIRDDMLIKANYFSLAVTAVFINTFFQVGEDLRPLIAMAGTATAYSFWLATESYKGARDSLNDSMIEYESNYQELSVVSDYDLRTRSPVGQRSLSSYFIGLQAASTVIWLLIYFVFIIKIIYL